MTTLQDRFRFVARGSQREKTPILAKAPATTTNESTGTVVLRLFDPIDSWGGEWGTSAKEFTAALDALPEDVEHLELHVNSPGGEVYEGLAILNALRQHSAKVTVVVDGIAASAASFVAMAGDEVVMSPNSELMIHDAFGMAMGTASTMTKTARDLNHLSDNIADVYARRAGGEAAAWRAAMLEETWFSAEEAVAAGLADRVGDDEQAAAPADGPEPPAATNRFDLSVFAHAGRSAAPAPRIRAHVRPPQTPAASAGGSKTPISLQEGGNLVDYEEFLSGLREALGLGTDADEGTILAAVQSLAAAQDNANNPQDGPTNSTRPAVPEGMQLVDASAFAQLAADAAAGRAARDEQESARIRASVEDAIRAGKTTPARREHWLNSIKADAGMLEVLEGLPAVVPVNELGHASVEAQADDPAKADNYWFPGVATSRQEG